MHIYNSIKKKTINSGLSMKLTQNKTIPITVGFWKRLVMATKTINTDAVANTILKIRLNVSIF